LAKKAETEREIPRESENLRENQRD